MGQEHPASYSLPMFMPIESADLSQVEQVCDDLLNEIDGARNGQPGDENIQYRINRLELAVLTLATAIRNKLETL